MGNNSIKFLMALLWIIPQVCFAQEVDQKKYLSNAPSIIQFYEFERAIQRNEEIVALYFALGNDDWKEDRELISNCISEEKKLKKYIQLSKVEPQYGPYRKSIVTLLDQIIRCFQDLYTYGPESNQFKNDNKVYQPLLRTHLHTLTSFFDEESYIMIDSVQRKRLKETAYSIPFPKSQEVKQLLSENRAQQAYQILLKDKNNLNIDRVLLYLSDILLSSKYRKMIEIPDADSLGGYYLYKIVEQNRYSPFLFEGWRKWRAIKQNDHGGSKTSEIPNDLYDRERVRLLKLILAHIQKYPSDMWAYVLFFELNQIEIIHRFGDYPYGNQSAIERNVLFYK